MVTIQAAILSRFACCNCRGVAVLPMICLYSLFTMNVFFDGRDLRDNQPINQLTNQPVNPLLTRAVTFPVHGVLPGSPFFPWAE